MTPALDVENPPHEGASFSTTVVRLSVVEKTSEEEMQEYLGGIGRDLKQFVGFVSRKIIVLPPEEKRARQHVVILKFQGPTPEAAFENMMVWQESHELKYWIKRGREIGVTFLDRSSTQHAVAKVDLSSAWSNGPPPKWKISIIIEAWVFVAVSFHAYAGTSAAVAETLGGTAGFTLLISLALVVPLLSYAALPLTLSVASIKRWANRRAENPSDAVAVLEDGLLLFTPEDWDDEIDRLKGRMDAMERKFEFPFSRRQSSLERIKKQHRVDLSDVEDKDQGEDSDDADETGGLTVAVRHRVHWDCVDEFDKWAYSMERVIAPFDGYLGTDLFKLNGDSLDCVTLFRFDTLDHMEAWLESDERARMLVKLQPLVRDSSSYAALGGSLKLVASPQSDNLLGALLFSEAAPRAKNQTRVVPVYKTTLLTLVGLFLVTWPVDVFFNPILDRSLPTLVSIFCSTCLTVILSTYIGLPFMLFLFHGWLKMPPPRPPTSKDPKCLTATKRFLVVGPKLQSTQIAIVCSYFAILSLVIIIKWA